MHLVKIQGKNEWWSAPNESDIQALSAKVSIDTGELVLYDEVDEIPNGATWVGELGNVTQLTIIEVESYDPEVVADANANNADYQRNFRKKMDDNDMRLLRVYVPIEYYDECYKFCKGMCDE